MARPQPPTIIIQNDSRKQKRPLASRENPTKLAIDRIKEAHRDILTPELWLRELLKIDAVDSVAILKQLPDFRWSRRGLWVRGSQMFSPETFSENAPGDGVEHFLASAFGDGTFQLQAITQHAQRGGFQFTVMHGKDSPITEPGLTDIDAVLANVAKRESNIAGVRQLRSLNDAGGKDEGMKPSEFKEMAEGMAALMRAGAPSSNGTDALLAELRAMREEMKGNAQATTPGLGAIIGPVAELLSKNPSGAWPFLRMFLNRVAPEARGPVEPPSKTFMESAQELVTGLGPVIAQFAQTPFGQAIVAKLLQGVTPPPNGTTVTENPIIEHEPQRPAIPPRPRGPFDDVLDAVVDQLRRAPDDRDFKALVGFLDSIVLDPQTDQRLLDRIAPIAKTTDELARVALRQIDARLVEQVWDGTRAFLDYLREHPREDDE